MYGKWVNLDFGDGIACSVWVPCTPDTPDNELQQIAMFRLAWKLNELKQTATTFATDNTETREP